MHGQCCACAHGQTIITPSRLGTAPLSVSVDAEGGDVVIAAENLFDVYRSDNLELVRDLLPNGIATWPLSHYVHLCLCVLLVTRARVWFTE